MCLLPCCVIVATLVLLGHSERRAAHGKQVKLLPKKQRLRWLKILMLWCVGETKVGVMKKAEQVVVDQLHASIPEHAPPTRLMIAYEPVWAIGTGAVASPYDIAAMHNVIASVLINDMYK